MARVVMTIDDIQWLGLGLVGLYLVLVEVLRFHLVGRPARALLEARVDGVRETARRAGLDEADPVFRILDDARGSLGRRRFPWIWTGGTELAGWTLVHRAEAMLVPSDRADLERALHAVQDVEDRAFDRLVTRHRQAAALGIVGLAFVGGVVLLGPSLVALVFVGAVGGFLNAMRRALRSRSAAFDDGAIWASTMLAPVIGALAAFAGIALVQLGSGVGILNLPAALTLTNPPAPAILGLALLFGFAEQFFEAPTATGLRAEVAAPARSEATRIVLATRLDTGRTSVGPATIPVASAPASSAPPPAAAPAASVSAPAPPAPAEAAAPPTPADAPLLTTYINWPSAPSTTTADTGGAAPPATAEEPPLTTYINWPSAPPQVDAEPAVPTPISSSPSPAGDPFAWPDVPPVPVAPSPANGASSVPEPEAGSTPKKPAAPPDWP
jgi:hypothetical protein